MSLPSGTRFGGYEVIALVGAGGMGEVYRARDSKLKRDVAIKVLPADVAGDSERLARFQREAEVLASLNHPNIAQIYGIEGNALVMELVAGEDLAQRIARGAIPIDEALPIAKQIAEALESAHDAGIVHRDLKPANVKLTDDGTVKVLDFGLAKALDSRILASSAHSLANSPTITSPLMTLGGVILGTAAYMAPEQAKGKAIDRRADVWALGCVLYEMLAGRKAFDGEDVTDTLTAVMRDQPDWNALPAATPPPIRTLLRRCLEKDSRKRAPHASVARLAIEDAMTPMSEIAIEGSAARVRPWRIAVASAAIAAALAAAAGYWAASGRRTAIVLSAYRATMLIAENLNPRSPSQRFAISPDGRRFVYVAADTASPRVRLWMRSLDSLTSQPLAGTEGATGPFWSPDSRFVAFFTAGELRKIDVNGGPPVTITSLAATNAPTSFGLQNADVALGMPGTWNADGVIIVNAGSRLVRVSAAGGATQFVSTLKDGETAHDYPQFLQDGRHFIFAAFNRMAVAGTYIGSLDGGPAVRILEDSSNAQVANGYLLFTRDNSLMAQPFDERRRTLSGDARPLLNTVLPTLTSRRGSAFSVSQNGVLVYQTAASLSGGWRIVWSTRAGAQTSIVDDVSAYRDLRLSPDGTRLALVSLDERGRSDLWVLTLATGVRTRLTFSGSVQSAAWSPDGKTLVFNGGASQRPLLRKAVDGGGDEQPLPGDDAAKTPFDWSPDGRTVLYTTLSSQSGPDVWAMPVDGTGPAVPIAASRFAERWPQFSPDGRWVAYASNESGNGQVYVTRFGGSGRWQISAAGGNYPRWSRDGRELFFATPDNKISVVEIKAVGDAIQAGPPMPLFSAPPPAGFGRFFYDVAPDGRFLVSTPASANNESNSVNLVVNWPNLLTPVSQ